MLHSVMFKLKEGVDKEKFLKESTDILAPIEFAKSFACYKETSAKNGFEFAFSFEFETKEDYMNYNNHQDHKNYINTHWIPMVEDFMETDWE